MLTGISHKGDLVVAVDVGREDGPWACPDCKSPLRYRSGPLTIAHFAHIPGTSPEYCDRVAESLTHERIKLAIFQAARQSSLVTFTQPEFRIGRRIADVAIIAGDKKIAVEVQLSSISEDEIDARTLNHQEHGFSVMWVLTMPSDWSRERTRHSSRAFQRYIHLINGGWFFTHERDLNFHCVHFMGYATRIKYYKRSFYASHLFDLIDEDGFISPQEKNRWWTKPSPGRRGLWQERD